MRTMLAAIAVTVLLIVHQGAMAAQHKVGDAVGWNFPPGGRQSFFADWAAQNSFNVGDSLSFDYVAGAHNVVQVTKADYDACSPARPVQLYTMNVVPTVVTLNNPGMFYYICGLRGHCEAGMKVALTVA